MEAFLDELASGAPTPGGGSAAAIIGAMGAALLSMVCNVTLGKKGQEAVESDMKAVRDESERLRARLTAMVADDIAAFDGLMAAYRLPKSNDEEKSRRAEAIQANLRAATETPLACARACARSRRICQGAPPKKASPGSSAMPAWACWPPTARCAVLRSMCISMRPRSRIEALQTAATAEIETLLDHCARESEAVFELVRSRLG